ncbi:replication initiator protein A [Deinococcus sp. SL84]|uniref:replication initiator protein A n=1 Tax=Deinococcus sp. SL84 TaxID=2994663 RepID=UPI002275B29E|nr:replication initiator protein A [Deinococcus sp. SL84]MCY1703996.1 replication initiator protein A [Deinococcus sp. SL84]
MNQSLFFSSLQKQIIPSLQGIGAGEAGKWKSWHQRATTHKIRGMEMQGSDRRQTQAETNRTQVAERNLSRIGLISALSRVPDNLTSWSRDIETVPFGSVRATCSSAGGHTVPHGLDSDILFGITNAFQIAGCPTDNTIRISTAELITLSNLTKSGRLYQQLQTSLDRLLHSTYFLYETWCDAQGNAMRTLSMSLLREVSSVDKQAPTRPDTRYSATTQLKIVLDPVLANSIRDSYLNELNPALYRELSKPMTRILYRLLSEYHLNNEHSTLTLEVHQLSQLLGFPTSYKAARIQRDLSPAHDELLTTGYLKEVTYSGRGKTCQVHYAFNDSANVSSSTYVTMLTSRGVSEGAAMSLLISYSEEDIIQACQRFDELETRGYAIKNRGGLLNDLIQHPHKYAVRTIESEQSTPKKSRPAKSEPDRLLPETPPAEPSVEDRQRTYANLLSKRVHAVFTAEEENNIRAFYLAGTLNTFAVQQLCSAKNPQQALQHILVSDTEA